MGSNLTHSISGSTEKPKPLWQHAIEHILLHIVTTGIVYASLAKSATWSATTLFEAAVVALAVVLVKEAFSLYIMSSKSNTSIRQWTQSAISVIEEQSNRTVDSIRQLLAEVKGSNAYFRGAASDFAGVHGSLYVKSNGTNRISHLIERDYLKLLTQAATIARSYYTIHKDRLIWFREWDPTGDFLRSLKVVPDRIRILVVNDQDSNEYASFMADLKDEELLTWYWNRANDLGNQTRTYWTTITALNHLERNLIASKPSPPLGHISDISKDIVICNKELTFKYNAELRELEYTNDRDTSLTPFEWVFDGLLD